MSALDPLLAEITDAVRAVVREELAKMTTPEPVILDADEWLPTGAAADLIGASASTLARWRAEGSGPPFARHGRVIRYHRDALRDWMADRTAAA
ncbi:helix-turn-helix transcriptional regulator [Corynebacterium hansenii]|uniref:Helix-turn-helix transcriptional regulator n=1 Tax=Corynebacterium hansenii TaxID=394964 RepID=A0ABV7ZJW3_9CORY|nr:helix-turn-helix domain-containing protein [Corynebacterium hansenii]WJY99315.1 Helix-turn-helix domain protein [Corynebacterium hansenii]